MSLFNHVETGSADFTVISKIADRYLAFLQSLPNRKKHHDPSKMSITMDLEVVHYIYGLNLVAMLDGKFADLMHDLGGIMAHLDRETGVLKDCFVPRYQSIQMGECWYCMNPVEPDDWTMHHRDGLMHNSCAQSHDRELMMEADQAAIYDPQR